MEYCSSTASSLIASKSKSSVVVKQLTLVQLSQPTMFPTRSYAHETVANCYGNGLKALKAILQRSHPSFVDDPSTLVTTYPKQKELSLLEYKMTFEDILQMRSMVVGHSRELDDPLELDVFIMNRKYRDYVQHITHDERHQLLFQCKYKGDHLLETLNSVLMNSVSPARTDTSRSEQRTHSRLTTPARDGFVRQSSRTPPRYARVSQIGANVE